MVAPQLSRLSDAEVLDVISSTSPVASRSQCGENTATNIPGVYAAGNASRGVQLVIAAAAEGLQAAFAINSALLDADAASNALRDHEPGQPTPSDRIAPGNEAVD